MSLSKSGIALVTVVVFVILISIIAIAAINLMAGQALLIEHQIQRIRAYYIAEAAIQKNLMRLFRGLGPESPTTAIDIKDPYPRTVYVNLTLQNLGNPEPVGTNSLIANYTYP